MKFALLLLACGGCAQLLGLDQTKFDQKDAMVDAPSVCDGAPACTFTTGRSVCGQLVVTGAGAGLPLRVVAPTGQPCAVGNLDGPCGLQVSGLPAASYFAGTITGQVAGQIDDCGRYVVPDLDATMQDVAIVFAGATITESTSLVLGRATIPGVDKAVLAYPVSTDTITRWGTQLDSTSPPGVTGSYLVSYVHKAGAVGTPILMEQLRVGGAAPNMPPPFNQPWGAYFTGLEPFGDLDRTLTRTGDSGSALLLPATGTFMLGGQQAGGNCVPVTVQTVGGAVVHITLSC